MFFHAYIGLLVGCGIFTFFVIADGCSEVKRKLFWFWAYNSGFLAFATLLEAVSK